MIRLTYGRRWELPRCQSLVRYNKNSKKTFNLSDRDGIWSINYDSIIINSYLTNYVLLLAIKTLNKSKLLSVHEIDLSKFPEKFNKNLNLVELL